MNNRYSLVRFTVVALYSISIPIFNLLLGINNIQQPVSFQKTDQFGYGGFYGVAWRPLHNQFVVSTSYGVTIFDTNFNGHQIFSTSESTSEYRVIPTFAWSKDGTQLAIAYLKDQALQVWSISIVDIQNSRVVSQFSTESPIPIDMDWSIDGKLLALNNSKGISIKNLITGDELVKVNPSDFDIIEEIKWDTSNQKIYGLSNTGNLRVWDMAQSNPITEKIALTDEEFITSFDIQSNILIVGFRKGSIHVLDTSTLFSSVVIQLSQSNYTSISDISINNDKITILERSETSHVKSWGRNSFNMLSNLSFDGITKISTINEGKIIVINEGGKSIRIYDLIANASIAQLNDTHSQSQPQWSTDSGYIFGGHDKIPVFKISTINSQISNVVDTPASDGYPVNKIIQSPNGNHIIIVPERPYFTIWMRGADGTFTQTIKKQTSSYVKAAAWTPDSSEFVILQRDGNIHFFDSSGIETRNSLKAHDGLGTAISWNPDGTRLGTASINEVKIWNTVDLALIVRLNSVSTHLSWNSNGTILVSQDRSGYPVLFSTETWNQLRKENVVGQNYSWQPNGNLIGGIYNNSILLWDTTALQTYPIAIENVSNNILTSFNWSPDGQKFVVKSEDETLHVFTRSNLSTPTPTLSTLTPTPRPDTIGVYRPTTSTFHFPTLPSVTFGNPNDHPITGDWDGDGIDTVGVFDPLAGRFLLRNSNTPGAPDLSFLYGNPGDIPLAGHWTAASTHDGVGTYRNTNGTMYLFLRNQLTTGYADLTAIVGNPGDLPIVGDWNGDGVDTVGLYRPDSTTFYLFNRNAPDMEVETQFTLSGGVPIAGRWTGSGGAGVGFFADGVFSLKDTLESGAFDRTVNFGETGDVPLAGRWSP
jgi:hypothetical protein